MALAALGAVPAAAQDLRLAEARKEGKVVWYTSGALPVAERLAKMFEQAHPGIKVEVHRSGAERIFQRLMQEAATGIRNCDVFNSSDAGHYVLLRRKGLYVPHPEVTYPADKPKLSDLKVLPINPEEMVRRTEEIKKRFVELFGA